MDYIPVYEGEDSDDGSVKLSPGKIQRTGVQVRAGRAARDPRDDPRARHHPARRAARLRDRDARRKASSRRSPTSPPARTSTKGQPLMEIYSPAVAVRRRRIRLDHQLQDHRRRRGPTGAARGSG